jgi:hypothetical protein
VNALLGAPRRIALFGVLAWCTVLADGSKYVGCEILPVRNKHVAFTNFVLPASCVLSPLSQLTSLGVQPTFSKHSQLAGCSSLQLVVSYISTSVQLEQPLRAEDVVRLAIRPIREVMETGYAAYAGSFAAGSGLSQQQHEARYGRAPESMQT